MKTIFEQVIYLFFLVLVLHGPTASGQGVTISGVILNGKTALPDAFIAITDSGRTIHLLSNHLGRFEVTHYIIRSDTTRFSIRKNGYFSAEINISDQSQLSNLVFTLTKDSVKTLEAVIVRSGNVAITANKKSYRIDPKDYIANAKSTAVIKNIPDLSIVNGNIKLDNRKNVMIFIDGIESGMQDLERLDVADIDKVEVISNPSAAYDLGQSGAVVQILTKKKTENFVKGEIDLYAGVRLGSRGFTPTIAFKSKKILFTSFFGYGTNNQNISGDLTRKDSNDVLFQNTDKRITGWQKYLSSRLKITLNPKSTLYFGGNLFAYQFDGRLSGDLNYNNDKKGFTVADTEKLNKWYLSSIYNYTLNKKSDFFLKAKYFDYRNSNQSVYSEPGINQSYSAIFSNTKEFSAEVIYNKRNAVLFKLPFEYSAGYKNIYRRFYFQDPDLNINQTIRSVYINPSFEFTKKLSLFSSFAGEITHNKSLYLNQQYFYFLPTLSFLYKVNSKTNLTFDYSRKITRPGSNYLNPSVIFFTPGYSLAGNSNLLPQVLNSYEISFQKQINDHNSFSFKLFDEHITHSIIETFTEANNSVLTSYENAGKSIVAGAYASLTALLFNKLSINVSSGLNYNLYDAKSSHSLIKENKGFSYNGSLYMSMLLKKVVSLSFNGNISTPYYTLINTTTNHPQFGFDAETSVLKKTLNIRLSYFDIFSFSAPTQNHIQYNQFYQASNTRNNRTNLTLTLIYKMGKQFSDRYRNPAIRNDDIITK